MEQQHQESNPTKERSDIDGSCDESKCVSKGLSDLFGDSFTCYGDDGKIYPRMCSDGFLPRIVESEPDRMQKIKDGETITLQYFTCCQPNPKKSSTATATRHCSDPIIVNDLNYPDDIPISIDEVCDKRKDGRRYLRDMQSYVETYLTGASKTDSFLCCDNDEANTDDYREEAECVPYRNEFYENLKVQNEYGWLQVISCDFSDNSFSVPRPYATPLEGANFYDVLSYGRYQCCRTGTPLPPFVQDSVFTTTAYLILVLYSLAAITSLIVAISLLIPLWKRRKRSRGVSQKTEAGSRFMLHRASTTFKSSALGKFASSVLGNETSSAFAATAEIPTTLGRREIIVSRRKKIHRYSSYNLYLVYLALFDLIYALFQISWYGSYLNQHFNPNVRSHLVSPSGVNPSSITMEACMAFSYLLANLTINAIISNQVLTLLKNSLKGIKTNPPSLKTVNKHGGGIFIISILYGSILYILRLVSTRAFYNDDLDNISTLFILPLILIFIVSIPPFGYVVYVTGVLIWKRGYVPRVERATQASASMRQLAIYFTRIVAVFFAIWIPVNALVFYASASEYYWGLVLAHALGGLQPLLTTAMVLTKSDVRKHVLDFVTLSYLQTYTDIDTRHRVSSGWKTSTPPSVPLSITTPDSAPNTAIVEEDREDATSMNDKDVDVDIPSNSDTQAGHSSFISEGPAATVEAEKADRSYKLYQFDGSIVVHGSTHKAAMALAKAESDDADEKDSFDEFDGSIFVSGISSHSRSKAAIVTFTEVESDDENDDDSFGEDSEADPSMFFCEKEKSEKTVTSAM